MTSSYDVFQWSENTLMVPRPNYEFSQKSFSYSRAIYGIPCPLKYNHLKQWANLSTIIEVEVHREPVIMLFCTCLFIITTTTFFSLINSLKYYVQKFCLSSLYIHFCFADVYNLLICNVNSGGPQWRLDLFNCVASVNKVLMIIIIILVPQGPKVWPGP